MVEIAPREQVEAKGKKWMVSTQGKHTTRIAAEVMRNGGNIVDAAIAASFAISVERPHSTGLGGGGFLIYHEAKTGRNHVFDFRERAPMRSTADGYLDQKKNVIPGLSVVGALAVATPGLVRGLSKVHHKFGKQPWKNLVIPARDLALKGFEIYPSLKRALDEKKTYLSRFPSSQKIFFRTNGSVFALGEKLIQKDLSRTLDLISAKPDDFYTGEISKKIIRAIRKEGGLLGADDLKNYQVKERQPVESNWKGYRLITMPPPSSGGVHVVQILKQLEKDHLEFLRPGTLHLIASSMQASFADRAEHLGDPDFYQVPTKGLIQQKYLDQRRSGIQLNRAKKQVEVYPGKPDSFLEHSDTTHLSMMDSEGNVVVSTQTINGFFGSSLVADETGIVLNNEMDDFSLKPGVPNIFGAVGGDANAIKPKKTPLSSMSPTMVFKGDIPVLAVGAPGGTRIITSVAQVILNHLEFKKDLYTSVAAPRIHQQWTPDFLFIEENSSPGAREEVSSETVRELEKLGWAIKRAQAQCNVMAVSRVQKADGSFELVGVADPRDIGTSAGE